MFWPRFCFVWSYILPLNVCFSPPCRYRKVLPACGMNCHQTIWISTTMALMRAKRPSWRIELSIYQTATARIAWAEHINTKLERNRLVWSLIDPQWLVSEQSSALSRSTFVYSIACINTIKPRSHFLPESLRKAKATKEVLRFIVYKFFTFISFSLCQEVPTPRKTKK